jgi:hypothetical protein
MKPHKPGSGIEAVRQCLLRGITDAKKISSACGVSIPRVREMRWRLQHWEHYKRISDAGGRRRRRAAGVRPLADIQAERPGYGRWPTSRQRRHENGQL